MTTILDFEKARRERLLNSEIGKLIESNLEFAADILSASDEQIDAILRDMPPEYREYVETGNDDAIHRLFSQSGLDDSIYTSMADMAVQMVNLAGERLHAATGN